MARRRLLQQAVLASAVPSRRVLAWLSLVQANFPFRTRPSWPKMLLVPDGCDVKRNPEALVADQFIVTGLLSSWPTEPGGLVTAERPLAGPSQRMSNDTVARTDAGVRKRSRALGRLKKSRAPRFAAIIRAVPAPRWIVTPPSGPMAPLPPEGRGAVQNRPPG